MSIFRIGISKLFSKPANTALSVLLFAIGVTIISLLMNGERGIREQFYGDLAGIDMVAGAKGSPLQLILSTVFHADAPTGNISLAEADKISRNPMVEKTIPIALGDNHRGFRIVGTTPDYGGIYDANLKDGAWFDHSGEVTIGWEVAQRTGLETGSEFTGVHGFMEHGHTHDYFVYEVKGVLNRTNTVIDRLILTPVQSVWDVHAKDHHNGDHHDEDCDHEHHQHDQQLEEIIIKAESGDELTREEMQIFSEHRNLLAERAHDPATEITALLVFFNSPVAAVTLPRLVNETTNMQAAVPAFELNRLLGLLAYGIEALQLLAWIIIIISGINIFVNLLNTLNQSAYEIALIRALGASRFKVLLLLLFQGVFLALAGWIAGIVLSRLIWIALPALAGVTFGQIPAITGHEMTLLLYTIITGFAGSLAPAIMAYRTNLHSTLSKA